MSMTTKSAAFWAASALLACARAPDRHPDIAASDTCDECEIIVTTVWSSRPGDGNVFPAGSYLEIRDTLWTLGEAAGSYFPRFPLDGGPSSLVSREGEGPGEFRHIDLARLHPNGDTIFVMGDPRIGVVTTALQEIRSVPRFVRYPSGMLVLHDGSTLIVDTRATQPAQTVGFALHERSATGEYVRSFRAMDSTHAIGTWPLAFGQDENTIWLVEPEHTGFVAQQWDLGSTEPMRELRIDPEWWVAESRSPQQYEAIARRGGAVPKLPSGTTAVWDSGTHLWVALRHFDPDHANHTLTGYQPHNMFDGVLVAVDRTSGDVMASVVFDEFLFGFTNRGRIVLYDVDDAENPRLRLADVSLTGR